MLYRRQGPLHQPSPAAWTAPRAGRCTWTPLARVLLDRGFCNLTVLDFSTAGMQQARDRLGPRADQVHWLTADVLSWHPRRRYQAWHDRAVFHFLTIDEQRQQYLRTLDAATAPGGAAVFGCFAPDGPQQCSGLPVAPLQCGAAGPPARRQMALDQPGPGRAHHPGWRHPAVHLDRAAKTVLSPGRYVGNRCLTTTARRSPRCRARGSSARPGSVAWRAPRPPPPGGRTRGRSRRHGSSVRRPRSPGPRW